MFFQTVIIWPYHCCRTVLIIRKMILHESLLYSTFTQFTLFMQVFGSGCNHFGTVSRYWQMKEMVLIFKQADTSAEKLDVVREWWHGHPRLSRPATHRGCCKITSTNVVGRLEGFLGPEAYRSVISCTYSKLALLPRKVGLKYLVICKLVWVLLYKCPI